MILGSLTITTLVLFRPRETPTTDLLFCSSTPQNSLDSGQLKPITVSAYSTLLSSTINSDQDIGYIFKAFAGQKIKYNKLDDVCVWIFTPDNKLMNGSTFPIDGKYIMQVASLKKSVNFNIYVSLEVNPNIRQEIDKNLRQSFPETYSNSPVETPSPDSTPSEDQIIFKKIITRHLNNLHYGNYELAWSQLSPPFQETLKDAENYGDIWKRLKNIQLLDVTIISQTINTASIEIKIEYDLDDQHNTGTGNIKLVFDSSQWLIDGVEINLDEQN